MPYCYNDSMCQILDENKQLKNCIASMNYFDMSPADYRKHYRILKKALDDTVNQELPKMEAMIGS